MTLITAILALVVSALTGHKDIAGFFGTLPWAQQATRSEVAKRYFRALTAADVSSIRSGDADAAPGSEAAKYLNSWELLIGAWRINNREATDSPRRTLAETSNGYNLCSIVDPTECLHFTRLSFDDADRLSSFLIDGAPVQDQLFSAKSSASYKSADLYPLGGSLGSGGKTMMAAVRLENYRKADIAVQRCLLQDLATGKQIATKTKWFPLKVKSWQTTPVYCTFEIVDRPSQLWVGLEVRLSKAQTKVLWVTMN